MNEPALLARQLVARLGDDIDTILPAPPNAPTPQVNDAARPDGAVVQLRQVAGLTAGDTINLPSGQFEFGEKPAGTDGGTETDHDEATAFSLNVDESGDVIIDPGESPVRLDGRRISTSHRVGQQTIDVGSARFVALRAGDRARSNLGSTPRLMPRSIVIPRLKEPTVPQGNWRKRGDRRVSDTEALRSANDEARDLIAAEGQRQAQERWTVHLDPTRISDLLEIGPGALWQRPAGHWHFGSAAIAAADLTWRPELVGDTSRLDDPELLAYGVIPSAPLVADLRQGPLGIVGLRAAALAVARHVIVTFATASPASDLELAVLTTDLGDADWAWTTGLPHTSGDDSGNPMPVIVVDDLRILADDSIRGAIQDPRSAGAILIADHLEDLPNYCSTTIVIARNGTAVVSDHRSGTRMTNATPIGISGTTAEAATSRLRDASLS